MGLEEVSLFVDQKLRRLPPGREHTEMALQPGLQIQKTGFYQSECGIRYERHPGAAPALVDDIGPVVPDGRGRGIRRTRFRPKSRAQLSFEELFYDIHSKASEEVGVQWLFLR